MEPTTVTIDVDSLVLESGSHPSPAAGMCVMELTAYLAHEEHSDKPACACPVISTFLRSWNDSLDDATRQRLKPYAARVIGTRGSKALEQRRAWILTDWIVREHTAAWLETAGLLEQSAALRALPELTKSTVKGAMPAINDARTKSAAAWDAARDAAWDAAWDAARAAARAAAWDAAWDAARDAARAAAWDAARDAAWDAARAAAWDGKSPEEVRALAAAKLAPTRDRLIESAFAMLDRLIEARDG